MANQEEDSILESINKTRELWNTKADENISYLTPKTPTTTMPKTVKENGVNGHVISNCEVVRAEDQIVDEFELPDIKSMKSKWEVKPTDDTNKITKKPPKHKTALDREKPASVPVNRETEEEKNKDEDYEVEMRKLKEHFEMEAKRSQTVHVQMRSKDSVTKDAVNKRVSMKRLHDNSSNNKQQRSINGTSSYRRFEEEIKVANSCETSQQKDDLPTVELSSLKNRFENNKDQKLINPENTGVPKRKPRNISMSSESSGPVDIVRSEDVIEDNFEVEIHSIRKKFENKSNETTVVTSKPITIERQQSLSSESSTESAAPSADVVRSSEAIYDEMVGEESVKERLQRFKELANQPTHIKHKVSIKRKEVSPKIKEDKKESTKTSDQIEIVRSPPAGTKEKPEFEASVSLQAAKALFDSPPRQHSRNSSTGRSSVRSSSASSRSYRSATSSPSPSRGNRSVSLNNSPRDDKSEILDENMEIVRPPPAGSKEVADYSPSVDLKSVRSMFENPNKNTTPNKPVEKIHVKRPIVVERKRSSSSSPSPERNPNIVRSSAAGQKEAIDYELPAERLSAVRSMFSGNGTVASSLHSTTTKVVKVENHTNNEREIVRSSVAREEPQYELSIDLKATRSMFDSPRPKQYEPKNNFNRSNSQKNSVSSEDIVHTTEAGKKEIPEYSVDLGSKKGLFEGGVQKGKLSSSLSSSSSSSEDESKTEVALPVQKEESSDETPTEEISKVKEEMFENGKIKNEQEREDEQVEAQEEKTEPEPVKEIEIPVAQRDESSSSSDSDTASEGEIQLSAPVQDQIVEAVEEEVQPLKEEVQERAENIVEEVKEEQQKLSSSSESEEELKPEEMEQGEKVDTEQNDNDTEIQSEEEKEAPPAAAVVPVRVAIPEPLHDSNNDTQENSDASNYSDVVKDIKESVEQSSESSEEEKDKKEVNLSSDEEETLPVQNNDENFSSESSQSEHEAEPVTNEAEPVDSMSSESSGIQTEHKTEQIADFLVEKEIGNNDTEDVNHEKKAEVTEHIIISPSQMNNSENQTNNTSQDPVDKSDAKNGIIDLLSNDNKDEVNEPLFDYPHDDQKLATVEIITPVDKNSAELSDTTNNSDETERDNSLINVDSNTDKSTEPVVIPSTIDNSKSESTQDNSSAQNTNNNSNNNSSADPFDLFTAPSQNSDKSNIAKDSFDLFI